MEFSWRFLVIKKFVWEFELFFWLLHEEKVKVRKYNLIYENEKGAICRWKRGGEKRTEVWEMLIFKAVCE